MGLTVGVLTGIGTQHDLADADVIVLDVNECVEMILPAPSEKQSTYVDELSFTLVRLCGQLV